MPPRNLLDLIPTRNRQWEMGDGDKVVILRPKFEDHWLGRWLLSRMKNPHYRVRLDAYGSWVWMKCDGRCTVKEIADGLKKHFGESIEPVYERLALFLNQLWRGRFIVYQDNSGRLIK